MPRVVLDSSVLVSAFLKPEGAVTQLLRGEYRRRYQLCLSEYILAETARTLLTKASVRRYATYTDATAEAYVRWLLTQAEMVAEFPQVDAVASDPADNPIVATAVAARADYLVTGDRRHLLPLGSYEGVRIVSVREFLEILRQP